MKTTSLMSILIFINFLIIAGEHSYVCVDCKLRFQDQKSFQDHLEDHKQKFYTCDICGTSLKRKEHLDRHKQEHNEDRHYKCTICSKAFKRNEHLARHMIINSGKKNQICTECGKGFYRKDHLKKHLQSHTNKINKNPNAIASSIINNDEILDKYSVIVR